MGERVPVRAGDARSTGIVRDSAPAACGRPSIPLPCIRRSAMARRAKQDPYIGERITARRQLRG
jgi:hypothetical protein